MKMEVEVKLALLAIPYIYISHEQVWVQHQCPPMALPLLQAPCPLLPRPQEVWGHLLPWLREVWGEVLVCAALLLVTVAAIWWWATRLDTLFVWLVSKGTICHSWWATRCSRTAQPPRWPCHTKTGQLLDSPTMWRGRRRRWRRARRPSPGSLLWGRCARGQGRRKGWLSCLFFWRDFPWKKVPFRRVVVKGAEGTSHFFHEQTYRFWHKTWCPHVKLYKTYLVTMIHHDKQ